MVLSCVVLLDPLNCLKLLHKQPCRGEVFLLGKLLYASNYSFAVEAINVGLSMLSTVSARKLLECSASSKRNDRSPSILGELGYAILLAGCAIELHLKVALVASVLAKFTLGILQNRAPLPFLAVREGGELSAP